MSAGDERAGATAQTIRDSKSGNQSNNQKSHREVSQGDGTSSHLSRQRRRSPISIHDYQQNNPTKNTGLFIVKSSRKSKSPLRRQQSDHDGSVQKEGGGISGSDNISVDD